MAWLCVGGWRCIGSSKGQNVLLGVDTGVLALGCAMKFCFCLFVKSFERLLRIWVSVPELGCMSPLRSISIWRSTMCEVVAHLSIRSARKTMGIRETPE